MVNMEETCAENAFLLKVKISKTSSPQKKKNWGISYDPGFYIANIDNAYCKYHGSG